MPKYTGAVKPEDWLSNYVTAVDIAGGNKRTAVRYAPLTLTGSARTWLNSLPALQINSWHDFQEAFIKNFTGTYKRLPRPRQLALCKQGPDEPDRDYLTRWSELRNSCERVGEEQAIGYFTDGRREGTLLKHKLHRAEPKSMADFMAIADKYASADSTARVQCVEPAPARGQSQPAAGQGGHHNRDRHGKRKDERRDNKYGSQQVAAVQGSPGATGGSQKRKGDKFRKDKYTIEVMLDQPCKFHSVSGKPAAHTTRQCSFTKDLEQGNHQLPGPPPGLPAEAQGNKNWQPAKAAGDYPEEANVEQYHVFTSQMEDPKDETWFEVEVNAVIQVRPQFMHWSDASITWGCEDHPPLMPRPGGYALVLDPIVFSETHTCRFSRVLIDGGSSINLLYRTSMEKLGIPVIQLKPTRLTFHGIVPGHSCTPMGRIELEVLFGGKDNHRREPIWFEVVDLNSPYHALLGRPTLAKFMAVPHYAYLKMKLPGPRGVITITGCYKKSIECARASSKLAEALVIAEEMRQLLQRVAAVQQGRSASSQPTPHLDPASNTKKVPPEAGKEAEVLVSGAGPSSR
jgi:hypothetical protein